MMKDERTKLRLYECLPLLQEIARARKHLFWNLNESIAQNGGVVGKELEELGVSLEGLFSNYPVLEAGPLVAMDETNITVWQHKDGGYLEGAYFNIDNIIGDPETEMEYALETVKANRYDCNDLKEVLGKLKDAVRKLQDYFNSLEPQV